MRSRPLRSGEPSNGLAAYSRPQRHTCSQYGASAPVPANHANIAALTAAKPAAIATTPAGFHSTHTRATSAPLGLIQNAAAANTPLQNGRREASQTAAKCGASINKSDATGIAAEGKSKQSEKPRSAAAQRPSRSLHSSRPKA